AHTELVVQPQRAQRVLDRVSTFDAEERTDLARRERLADIGRRQRPREYIGVVGDHLARDVDLLHLHAGEAGVADGAGDVHRPELPAHATRAQARNVGVAARASGDGVLAHVTARDRVLPDRPREVIVP